VLEGVELLGDDGKLGGIGAEVRLDALEQGAAGRGCRGEHGVHERLEGGAKAGWRELFLGHGTIAPLTMVFGMALRPTAKPAGPWAVDAAPPMRRGSRVMLTVECSAVS
jgi:hypothetical protein